MPGAHRIPDFFLKKNPAFCEKVYSFHLEYDKVSKVERGVVCKCFSSKVTENSVASYQLI